jgi:hypothetical protein
VHPAGGISVDPFPHNGAAAARHRAAAGAES